MNLILGIDEVGRGPIAGPLTIGACVLSPRFDEQGVAIPAESWQAELNDSKKLSEAKREHLDQEIRKRALAYGLGWVPAEELNQLGIMPSLRLAARRAVGDLVEHFPDVHFSEIILDGNINFLQDSEYDSLVTTVIKGDQKIKEISAASIIAKVARDRYMVEEAHRLYPMYHFDRHKGYGTKAHLGSLDEFGPCPEHRSFIKYIEQTFPKYRVEPTSTEVGRAAEQKVADFLATQKGHKILSRNYRRRDCEIDIVSADDKYIYFTEVKYRSSQKSGAPAEVITRAKLQQMHYATTIFMRDLSKRLGRPLEDLPSPLLAIGTVDPKNLDWLPLTED